jgi:hypothetical protein
MTTNRLTLVYLNKKKKMRIWVDGAIRHGTMWLGRFEGLDGGFLSDGAWDHSILETNWSAFFFSRVLYLIC